MKWLRLFIPILVLSWLILPTPVQAANPVVTITVSAWVVGAPGGLTITYIDNNTLRIDWVKGVDAENTMVRAKYGSAPIGITDGYQVYYGTGVTVNDTSVDVDNTINELYYTAFSQNIDGDWGINGVSGVFESAVMILIALLLLSLVFTVCSYVFKKGALAFAGAGGWIATAVYCYTTSTAEWDIYYILFFLACGLVIASAFSPLAYRETTPANEDTEDPDDRAMREEIEAITKERRRFAYLNTRNAPRKRMSRFARKGIDD